MLTNPQQKSNTILYSNKFNEVKKLLQQNTGITIDKTKQLVPI